MTNVAIDLFLVIRLGQRLRGLNSGLAPHCFGALAAERKGG
jgi:hypothetical protein